MKNIELKGKFLVAFDTIVDGHQVGTDEDGNPCPELYDSYDEAFKELFTESIAGINGNEEHLEDVVAREKMLVEVNDPSTAELMDWLAIHLRREPEMIYMRLGN